MVADTFPQSAKIYRLPAVRRAEWQQDDEKTKRRPAAAPDPAAGGDAWYHERAAAGNRPGSDQPT